MLDKLKKIILMRIKGDYLREKITKSVQVLIAIEGLKQDN